MTGWKFYHSPGSVQSAVDLLARYEGRGRVIAGGTDLLLELQQGHQPPVEALIDITKIDDLTQIMQTEDDYVTIGAGVTHNRIVRSQLLADRATCLVESCGVVGGPQVRNVGTLGGNVAHALPAGDGSTSLVALDASVEIVKDSVRQWVHILDMFKGPGKSLIDSTRDMIVQFRFRLNHPGEAAAFKRVMRPQGVALPVLGCAVWVKVEAETLSDVRICMGPVAPTPVRLSATESALRGLSVSNEENTDRAIALGVETVRSEVSPRTSKYRATAEYRVEVAQVLLQRALRLAVHRAKTGEVMPEGVGLQ